MAGVALSASVAQMMNFFGPGFSGTVTIPTGVNTVDIWLQAAGGSGAERSGTDGAGGGGGGYAKISRAVLSGEWGTNLTIAVGDSAVLANGGNTTLTGTLNGASVSITCNGGNKGTALADGTGGTATGGDTNVSGYDATGFQPASPGPAQPGIGGAGGGDGQAGALDSTFSGYGAGSNGAAVGGAYVYLGGYIKIVWS